ncbi:uncharacterized protein LOC135685764 isoform X2 [Rhopilema esculentum]|uniref:uncharacterized protein LOC135685764 isoform X2 n=1 Tax=Rhopilema esculentum TaxID=499914 RepID=UPI0031E3B83A
MNPEAEELETNVFSCWLKSFDVQRRFPSDDLYLNQSLNKQMNLLGDLGRRRKSSPAQVINKIQEKLSKSSTNLNADIIPRSARSPTPDELSPNVARNFIREGAVCLSTGVSSLNRYMFLFSDLLLIAKPKSGASFKLKLRLPVSELWLQSAIDGVCESTVAPNKSFVVGWPTVSYVATFSTTEDKTLWWNVLKKTIEEQRAIEGGRTVPIRIIFRDTIQKNSAPLSLPVSNEDDVKSVVNMALQGFGIAGSDVNDFQLWVVSGKENAAYPLMGHEIPFCIKMNHIRQASCNVDSPVTERTEFDPEQVHSRSKCEFILKKKKNSTGRLDVDSPNSQKRWKSPMKSPIINWALHKKPQKQNSIEERSQQGSFFGLPLGQVSADEEQLPTPVQDMLTELFRRGPSTVGIFRKSALMKSVKQLRQELDEGKIVNFEEKSAVVIATVLKEFLRGLPACAFGSEFLNEMLETNDITDPNERAAEIDKNLNKLPKLNQILIKKFFCVLYHIARLSETNKMTAQNLAICIAPSLVWSSKTLVPSSPKETTSACELVQFIIDNYTFIFGEDATTILGDISEIQAPIVYDDEEMPEQNSDTPDAAQSSPTQEELSSRKTGFSLSLRVPDSTANPDFSPTSPEIDRKSNTVQHFQNGGRLIFNLKKENRRHSENDLTDLNDNFPVRKLRAKVPLSSYTATAELIKHRTTSEDDSNETSPTVIKIVSTTNENSPPVNGRRKNSPSNHAIYHQKVRPTPTYEEAIRQLRRNAQFSPTFTRKYDWNVESSNESIDQTPNEKRHDAPKVPKNETGPSQVDVSLSFAVNEKQENDATLKGKTVDPKRKLETQKFAYRLGSPSSDRLKTSRYTAEDFRRKSPNEIFVSPGHLRSPVSPSSYEEHLQRRKRFEKAYLQKINLNLNDGDFEKTSKGVNVNSEFTKKGADFTHSYNGGGKQKTSQTASRILSKSLDSKGLRALKVRPDNENCDSIPLSNGVHTFVTQRKSLNTNGTSAITISPKSEHSNGVKGTPSLDRHSPSLRAAIEAGTFMYRKNDATKGPRFDINEPIERNNNQLQTDCFVERPRKLSDRTAENFDQILAGLKDLDDVSSSSSSSTDIVSEVDVPSHEDIKNILCQDESYV